jgi:hypothetical protein
MRTLKIIVGPCVWLALLVLLNQIPLPSADLVMTWFEDIGETLLDPLPTILAFIGIAVAIMQGAAPFLFATFLTWVLMRPRVPASQH